MPAKGACTRFAMHDPFSFVFHGWGGYAIKYVPMSRYARLGQDSVTRL